MQLKVRWRYSHYYACYSSYGKQYYKAQKPQHRRSKTDSSTEHSKQPIKYLYTCRYGNNHCHDAKETINIRAGTHSKEMMQPHCKGKQHYGPDGPNHRSIAKQWLAREGCHNFREHPKSWQY